MKAIRNFLKKYPIVTMVVSVAAGYLGGQKGVDALAALLALLGVNG